MNSIISLWLPILLSSVFVFIISSVIHMVFTYHKNDFGKLPDEENVMNELRKFNIPPGDYVMPYCETMKAMGTPEFIEKRKTGPVAIVSVYRNGEVKMGMSLFLWFCYSIVIGIFSAYIVGHALEPGAPYSMVFRYVGMTAFLGYSAALWQNWIWYKRSFKAIFKSTFDGLIYALFTAGTFGWLWPTI